VRLVIEFCCSVMTLGVCQAVQCSVLWAVSVSGVMLCCDVMSRSCDEVMEWWSDTAV
jgi:hypothetical protein